jgi:hypothetical protein
MGASNYELARDCVNGVCATPEEVCGVVCAQLNSTLGTADAGPCTTDGDGGPPAVTACMPLPEAGTCPTNYGVALLDFLALNCPNGWEPGEILAGPTSAMGQCCYTVHLGLCAAGGRPYLVDGRARTASAARAVGWSEGGTPCLAGLTRDTRADLASEWTAQALAEHASVASFARFALDLMAVGAPAELVEDAHRAAIDEVKHARLSFALAAAYGGEEIAPGPFPVAPPTTSDGAATLLSLAVATAAEGCVDETIQAVLAEERAARATDPAVRAALETIAADEARHAELAWRTVAWAVCEGGDDVLGAVERAIELNVARARAALKVRAGWSAVLSDHGLMSPRTAVLVATAAIADVIVPATSALRRSRPVSRTSSMSTGAV